MDRWRPLAQDGLLAAVMAILLSVIVFYTPHAGALDFAAVLAGSLALVAWRRAPLVSLLVSTACMLVVTAHIQPGLPAAFPVMVSVFAAVWAGHRLAGALASLAFLGTDLVVHLPGADGPVKDLQNTALLLGWFLAAAVAGMVDQASAGLPATGRAAGPRSRAHPGGGGAAPGGRGTAAHRQGTARLAHPQHLGHQGAGRGGRPPRAQARAGGAGRAAGHRRGQRRGDARAARHPGGAARLRRRRAPRAAASDRLDELVERARSTGLPATRRRSPAPAGSARRGRPAPRTGSSRRR